MPTNDYFPQFSALPTELRLKIWRNALSEPIVAGFSPRLHSARLPQILEWPILSTDHSCVAQACKEAWQVMRSAHQRVEFSVITITSRPFKVAAWIDFSDTSFYIGHGRLSYFHIRSMTPQPISTRVEEVIMGWSNDRELVETCKRLVVFQALRRLVILITPRRDLGIPERFVTTALDLQDMKSQISGQSSITDAPSLDTKHLRSLFEDFIKPHVRKPGQRLPVVEIVISSFALKLSKNQVMIFPYPE
jgi:hypothetical protein